MNIVFAKPAHCYGSYQDLYRLIELSGFLMCSVGEMDFDRDITYITAPVDGQLRARCGLFKKGERKAKVIFWNLERLDSGNYPPDGIGASNRVDEITKFVDDVWVSDRHYASLDPRLIYVPMGSDARLAEGVPGEKSYDIAALTYNNERRNKIYGPMGKRWRMAPASAWGDERARILNSSRCMLYVHQTPMPIGAPLRFALAAAYKLPLICESMADPYPLREGRDFLSCPLGEMVAKAESLLSSDQLSLIGENLHHTLCLEFPFRKCVEDGVARSFGAR